MPEASTGEACTEAARMDTGGDNSVASGGTFEADRYRNLLQEAGHSRKEARKKIHAAFRQLSHGDAATLPSFPGTAASVHR